MTWDEFIRRNRLTLEKNHGYELIFVERILSRVPDLDPDAVTCQQHFLDADGRNRFIDFAIQLPRSKKIAIEIDGFDKTGDSTGPSRAQHDDEKLRHSELVSQGWVVLRFTNRNVANRPDLAVAQIAQTLRLYRNEQPIDFRLGFDGASQTAAVVAEAVAAEAQRQNARREQDLRTQAVQMRASAATIPRVAPPSMVDRTRNWFGIVALSAIAGLIAVAAFRYTSDSKGGEGRVTTAGNIKLSARRPIINEPNNLAPTRSTSSGQPQTKVFLNDAATPVYFSDGDTFTVLDGPLLGTKATLLGFNTLETLGAMRRWGTWDPHELYINAKMATLNARRGVWHCFSDMKKDSYARIRWECPDLAEDNIRKGLAHAMSIANESSAPRYVVAQKLAQQEKRGMWAKGIPPFILASVHSNDDGYEGTTYNRLISTADGHAEKWIHKDNYKECEWVCHEGGSCMMYVPNSRLSGDHQAPCLLH